MAQFLIDEAIDIDNSEEEEEEEQQQQQQQQNQRSNFINDNAAYQNLSDYRAVENTIFKESSYTPPINVTLSYEEAMVLTLKATMKLTF